MVAAVVKKREKRLLYTIIVRKVLPIIRVHIIDSYMSIGSRHSLFDSQ